MFMYEGQEVRIEAPCLVKIVGVWIKGIECLFFVHVRMHLRSSHPVDQVNVFICVVTEPS